MKTSYISTILENNPHEPSLLWTRKPRRIMYVNNAAARMIGTPSDEVENKVCHRFICPADVNKCPVCDLGQTIDRSERVLLRSDGTILPILKTVIPITIGGAGKPP